MLQKIEWKTIAGTVGSIAASVAPLLGGPIGVAASIGAQIASALGTDNRPEAVLEKLQTDPSAALQLQQWAHHEREQIRQAHLRLQELELQNVQATLADRQQARHAHQDHWMPSVLTLALLGLFALVLAALFFTDAPAGNRDLIVYLVGNLFTLLAGAVTYWVSSTKESSDKDKLLGSLNRASDPAKPADTPATTRTPHGRIRPRQRTGTATT